MATASVEQKSECPICPYCGVPLSGEDSVRRIQMVPPVGGTSYGGLETVVCTKCHKVLGVR